MISGFYRNVSFLLLLGGGNNCSDTLNNFCEGIEFSLQMNSRGDWIPLSFIYRNTSRLPPDDNIYIGERDDLTIRGYQVQVDDRGNDAMTMSVKVSVQVCDFDAAPESIQFRWLQTARISGNGKPRDVWRLDDVLISYEDVETETIILLNDSFDGIELK